MLGSFAIEVLGTLAPHATVLAALPVLAVAVLAALLAARAAARVPVVAPVALTPTGPRHHYHRAAPYVRHKDLARPGRPSPRAPAR